jgi:DnaJ-domain-containing protein 1
LYDGSTKLIVYPSEFLIKVTPGRTEAYNELETIIKQRKREVKRRYRFFMATPKMS